MNDVAFQQLMKHACRLAWDGHGVKFGKYLENEFNRMNDELAERKVEE